MSSASSSGSLALETRFLQYHLDHTSRSFAFCIARLSPPLRQWISLSYLLCRVLDTVEDSEWPTLEMKLQQFDEFQSFIQEKPASEKVRRWIQNFPSQVSENYLKLIADTERLLQGLHDELDFESLQVCQACILKMAEGMRLYTVRSPDSSLRLSDLGDVNRYCFYVAGIVGELIRKLYCHSKNQEDQNAEFKINSFHFGLYLQKINLLKDSSVDESEGRFLVPDRSQLILSLKENARGALKFLMALPLEEKGLRLFCAWSLFVGLATLKKLELSADLSVNSRLPRWQTLNLIEKVERLIQKNERLQSLFNSYLKSTPSADLKSLPNVSTPTWFQDSVQDILSLQEMKALGL